MNKKKRILLDVDEVICFSGYLEAVNDFLNTNYKIDDFVDYYLDEVAVPKEKFSEFMQFVSQRNLYEYTTLLPNAIEVIKKLNEKYDIYICSSCVNPFDIDNSGKMYMDKFNFLRKYLPFLSPEKFIFTSVKYMFKADIQIDDRISNFDKDIKIKILFPSYHNKDITKEQLHQIGAIRAGYDWHYGWQEIEKILLSEDDIGSKLSR